MRYIIRCGLFCWADSSSQRRVKPGSVHSFHFLSISIWANKRVTWQCTEGWRGRGGGRSWLEWKQKERDTERTPMWPWKACSVQTVGEGRANPWRERMTDWLTDCWCGFSTITIPGNRGQAYSAAAAHRVFTFITTWSSGSDTLAMFGTTYYYNTLSRTHIVQWFLLNLLLQQGKINLSHVGSNVCMGILNYLRIK